MEKIITEFEGRLIQFLTKDKIKLTGFLSRPDGSKTCIIYVHGLGSNFYSRPPLYLAHNLKSRNISLFSINTRGHDLISNSNREVKSKAGRRPIGTNLEKFEESVIDIKAAVDTVKNLGFRKISLCGLSTGCQKIAYYQYKIKDKRIASLILIAPADDYNIRRKELKIKFSKTAKLASYMIRKGRGSKFNTKIPYGYSAQRFDSFANPKRIESRIFNYNGELKEFSSIKIPVLAIFGSKEEYALKPVREYLEMLGRVTSSECYHYSIIKGADHKFRGYELELSNLISSWIKKMR